MQFANKHLKHKRINRNNMNLHFSLDATSTNRLWWFFLTPAAEISENSLFLTANYAEWWPAHLYVKNTIQCDYSLHACVRTMLQPHTQRPHCSSRGGNMLYREVWLCQRANKVPTVSVWECWPPKNTLLSILEQCYRCGQSAVSLLLAFNVVHSLAPFCCIVQIPLWGNLTTNEISFQGNWST